MEAQSMNEITREALFNQVRDWTLQAGILIREKINSPGKIDIKSNPNELITEVDKELEFFFANKINKYYPNHLLLGEEGYGHKKIDQRQTIWILDPIDGTMNFIHQKQNFAISIGIYDQGIGEIGFIYDVMNNNLYSAMRGGGAFKNDQKLEPLDTNKQLNQSIICLNHYWLTENKHYDHRIGQQLVRDARGIRTYGSAALEFAYVAEGALDAYISMRLEPWDVAAGKIIVREVGGITTDIHGNDLEMLERSSILTCNPSLHDTLINNYFNAEKVT